MKEIYRKLCIDEPTIPLFSQDWWLDSVAGDNWDVCLVQKRGEIVASMPYVMTKRYGFTFLSLPPLTQNLGPWLKLTQTNNSKRLSQQKDWMQELIDQLPEYDHFNQNWHYSQTNWLPFYWRGFEQSTRYTYVIEALSDLDKVFGNFNSSYRNKIRKASKLVSVERNMDPSDFFAINQKVFLRQGITTPYTEKFFLNHDKVLKAKKCREIFYAKDSEGNIHSALYLTWDNMSSYVHMIGEDPVYRNSGAGILLIWEAIKYTKEILNLNVLDFEGSMLENVERVRKDCGGIQKPYFTVTHKPSKIINIFHCLKKVIKG